MAESVTENRAKRAQQGLLLLTLALSLFLRLWRIDEFFTIDEHNWRIRSIEFYQGLANKDYLQTCRTEHPGVLTMWAGVGGYLISERLETADISAPWLRRLLYPLEHDQGTGLYPETMWARRIIALVTWLGIVGLYLLGRRLLSPTANLCATLLVALDPFYLAFSRLHHLDGLLACFMALSLGALLVYGERGKRGYLLLSGAMAALATLNKAPGVFLAVGMVGILGWYGWRGRADHPAWLKRWALDALLWAASAVAVGFALWPALWSSPTFALRRVFDGVLHQASNPHEKGNFFFRPVEDPGILFYPVAWVLRTTPLVLAGLLGLCVRQQQQQKGRTAGVALLLFAAAYVAFMTLSLKKFDRYILPIFPLLCVPAGLGWERLIRWLLARQRAKQWWPTALGGGALIASVAMLLPAAPYYTAYYNPLVGGAAVAPRVLLVGWGEGMEQAARYLNSKPNAAALHVTCVDVNEFIPFFAGHTTSLDTTAPVDPDYFVMYSSYMQRDYDPELLAELEGQAPEFVARAPNGLAYAWVYANHVLEAEINAILERAAAEPDGGLVLLNTAPTAVRHSALAFDTISTERRDYLLTELERQRARHEAVWFVAFDGVHEASSQVLRETLNAVAAPEETITFAGVTALRYPLAAALLPRPEQVATHVALGDRITLTGYDPVATVVEPGDTLDLGLYWQASDAIATSYKIFVHVVSADEQVVAQDDSMPQGNTRPTTSWQAGQLILDEHTIKLPDELPTGEYRLYVGMYELESMQRLPIVAEGGERVPDDRLLLATLTVAP